MATWTAFWDGNNACRDDAKAYPLRAYLCETATHRERQKASVVMQRMSYLTETVLPSKITRNILVLSFKDSPRKPLGRRPKGCSAVTFEAEIETME